VSGDEAASSPGLWAEVKGHPRVVAAVLLAIAALGVGAYLVGRSTGADLNAAREAGATAGKRHGTAVGRTQGYAEGFKEGHDKAFEKAFADTFRKAYRQAFKDAGLPPPRQVPVPGG
jgi:hypothetical protein